MKVKIAESLFLTKLRLMYAKIIFDFNRTC